MPEVGGAQRPVAVVTGAASGIGLATAGELAEAGLEVIAIDRDAEALAGPAGFLGTPNTRAVDVTDADAMSELMDSVGREHGRLDLVVAGAGVHDQGQVAGGDPERWRAVVEANLLGVAYTARAALPRMLTQRSGHIIVLASVSGRVTYVGEPVYVASKHGVVALADSLRQEVAGQGIRVTLVEPGLVDTPMLVDNPFAAELMKDITPLHPEDCARLIRIAFEQPPHVSLNEIVVRPTGQVL